MKITKRITSHAFLALLFAVVSFILACSAASAQTADETKNAVRVVVAGGPAPDAWGLVLGVEYERYLGSGFALGLRPGWLTYGYDDGDYTEDGDGYGADVCARYYFKGQGMWGFYLGGAVGGWGTSWDWAEGTANGSGDSFSINLQAEFGYRFLLANDRLSIAPAVVLGDYLAASSDDDAQFGFYAAFGLVFGYHF